MIKEDEGEAMCIFVGRGVTLGRLKSFSLLHGLQG